MGGGHISGVEIRAREFTVYLQGLSRDFCWGGGGGGGSTVIIYYAAALNQAAWILHFRNEYKSPSPLLLKGCPEELDCKTKGSTSFCAKPHIALS